MSLKVGPILKSSALVTLIIGGVIVALTIGLSTLIGLVCLFGGAAGELPLVWIYSTIAVVATCYLTLPLTLLFLALSEIVERLTAIDNKIPKLRTANTEDNKACD